MNTTSVIDRIRQQRILPLFYHSDIDVCRKVITVAYDAGIRAVEFTNRGAMALQNFRQLTADLPDRWPDLQLGIGTILHEQEAQHFIEAKAAFVVCPGVVAAVAKVVQAAGLLWIPGCMTPTEIITAKENGATLVKIFPGSVVGPAYIGAIKEVFSDMLFMPTGGVEVSEANLSAWFRAGVCAVGLGSKVISKEALEKQDYNAIAQLIATAMELAKKQ